MSAESFQNFSELVFQDIALQEKLRDITDEGEFNARVIELGIENGFRFSPEDVRDALIDKNRAWIERWL